jgi:hypothetical protein
MADYYPLISRAVAGLEKNSGEARRALYERARAALLAQLRGVTPALNESDITRERLALEESIRKVEAESARQFVEPSRQPPAPKIRPAEIRQAESRTPEPRQWEEMEPPSPPPRRYVNPPSPGAQGNASVARQERPQPERQEAPRQEIARQDPVRQDPLRPDMTRQEFSRQESMRQESARQESARQESARADTARRPRPALPDPRQSDSIFDQPLPPSEPPPAPQRHPLRRQTPDRRSLSDSGLKDFRNVVSEANELGAASARAERSAREALAAMPTEDLDRSVERPAERPPRAFDRGQIDRSEPRMFDSQAPQERMFDPPPPLPPRPHQDFSEPMLEPSFALDDSRPVPPKGRRAPPPVDGEEEDYERTDEDARPRRSYRDLIAKGLVVVAVLLVIAAIAALFQWQWPNMVAAYRSFRAPAVEIAREVPPAATRPKITDRIEPGSQPAPASPAAVPGSPGTAPAAAVAQKVVLYEEDPADPNGKRFVGSAIWRTETVTPGPGLPPELAVRADVEVPERKLAMTWSLRRNTDKGLPATHTIEIMFKLPADFPAGGISGVPGILMKQAEQTRGVALAGHAVKVTPGFYLVGLSNGDAEKERNLQLLKERAWFDIPVVYNNNRRAILAMEKGTPGERAFADAFKAWKQ